MKWHEFAIFVVLPVVIVLIFPLPICILWLLLLIPFAAVLDLGRRIATERNWSKLLQISVGILAVVGFGVIGYRSIDEHTKPVFVYLRPGVATFDDRINWTLMTMVRTNRPVFNVKTEIDDEVTGRAVKNVSDLPTREAMIRGSHVFKNYSEADPAQKGDVLIDQVLWKPIEATEQEYSFEASYRIGEVVQRVTEELRIKGDDPKAWTKTKWSYAMRVKNEQGRVLAECRDAAFPADSEWPSNLPTCLPKFPDVAHFPLLRCLY